MTGSFNASYEALAQIQNQLATLWSSFSSEPPLTALSSIEAGDGNLAGDIESFVGNWQGLRHTIALELEDAVRILQHAADQYQSADQQIASDEAV